MHRNGSNRLMRLGYNTNGLAHHSLPSAIELLAEIGYQGIAITVDHAALNPFSDRYQAELDTTRELLTRHKMRSVIETGARFLLNPHCKHEPTLLSNDPSGRSRRIDFLERCIDMAAVLESDCVSLWSGKLPPDTSREIGMSRLIEGLVQVVEFAEQQNVTLGFEPEPGMLIATTSDYERLSEAIRSPRLMLTLDIGHLHCQGEIPMVDVIHRVKKQIVNIHIEDMRADVHEHLMFGEGEIDFPSVIAALVEVDYQGPLNVELSRHSHMGAEAAVKAFEFLNPLISGIV